MNLVSTGMSKTFDETVDDEVVVVCFSLRCSLRSSAKLCGVVARLLLLTLLYNFYLA